MSLWRKYHCDILCGLSSLVSMNKSEVRMHKKVGKFDIHEYQKIWDTKS